MNAQVTTPAVRPNRYPGACSICSIHVRAGAGALVGKRTDPNGYQLRCDVHASILVPPSDDTVAVTVTGAGSIVNGKTTWNGPERPEVSRAAMDLALATYQRARDDADAPAIATVLAWEIVAALAFCRGETIDRARLDADATTRPEHADAAASLVDDLLGGRFTNDADPHADDDVRHTQAIERAEIEREQAERATLPAPAPARKASKPRASKASDAGNPFAHRVKGK